MPTLQNMIRRVAIVSSIFLLSIAAGCSKPSDKVATGIQAYPSGHPTLRDLRGSGAADTSPLPVLRLPFRDCAHSPFPQYILRCDKIG